MSRKIFFGNCEAWGGFGLALANRRKSEFKTVRWVSYAQSGDDIVVCHLPSGEDYLAYRKEILGFIPHVLCPAESDQIYSLTAKSLRDTAMLNRIRSIAGNDSIRSYEIEFAVVTEDAQALSDYFAVPVAAPGIGPIQDGSIDRFNSKIDFTRCFNALGFRTPKGLVAFGADEIEAAARQLLSTNNSLMLRKAQGANCLGIKEFRDVDFESFCAQVRNLEQSWFLDPILVEPFLSLESSPCTLGFITPDREGNIVLSGNQLFADSAYCWLSPPTCKAAIIEQMESWFLRYTNTVARAGAVGWLDIDWGVTADQELVGIESNYRMTGWTAMAQLLRSMYGERRDAYPMFFSSDVLPLRDKLSFQEVYRRLDSQKALFRKEKKAGVFVTSPPNDQYIGMALFGENHSDLYELMQLARWITPTFDEFAYQDGEIVRRAHL